jgi:predicted metal-dependent hydrolase
VPSRCGRRAIEEAVHGRLDWVRRKLAEYEAMGPPPGPRRFADGERLPYRGRWYGLHIAATDGAKPVVALRRGRFELSRSAAGGADLAADEAREAFAAWYTARAHEVLAARVELFSGLAHVRPAGIRVRDMGKRWGSCHSRSRLLSFHWETVLLPPRILDYIVVHELLHLIEPNHGPRFWSRVEAVLPDWKDRRRWLRTDAQAFQL